MGDKKVSKKEKVDSENLKCDKDKRDFIKKSILGVGAAGVLAATWGVPFVGARMGNITASNLDLFTPLPKAFGGTGNINGNADQLDGQHGVYYRCASGCSWTCTGGCLATCFSGCTGCTGCTDACTGCTGTCSGGCTGGCTSCTSCTGSCTSCVGVCSCFVAGTKVKMADGSEKNIEDVEVGESVVGREGIVNKVVKLMRPAVNDRATYLLNGKLEFTPEHPLLTRDGWKVVDLDLFLKYQKEHDVYHMPRPGLLKVGDAVIKEDGEEVIETLEKLNIRPSDEIVYDLIVEGENHSYLANRYVSHDSF